MCVNQPKVPADGLEAALSITPARKNTPKTSRYPLNAELADSILTLRIILHW
jgi:hypothetical protein